LILAEFDTQEERNIFRDVISLLEANACETLDVLISMLIQKHEPSKVLKVLADLRDINLFDETTLQADFSQQLLDQQKFWNRLPKAYQGADALTPQQRMSECQLVVWGGIVL
jgi:hypothetical protein